ncbi:hypothetical protein F8388_005903 [Cannabis sativa]|uniref:Uncharacterized protein n=1 Tax=Cannabis sativa TaxID=3483 RepID=A0A7J6HI70_CANSA|nr:hypothetical protein F8388_005903 [Cannabis sativa]KAF4404494.1 hypothetical protein G4B88_005880 [Cannabis sativa]
MPATFLVFNMKTYNNFDFILTVILITTAHVTRQGQKICFLQRIPILLATLEIVNENHIPGVDF